MKVGKIKQLSKKSLSVLLAVIMIMSSMSIAFGTYTFAAGSTVDTAKWNELIAALKNDTVKNANFTSKTANDYVVNDPDGKIIDAVELYFEIFDTLADKAPSKSSDGNRTINQVNTTIKNELSNRMSGDYSTYNVATFIGNLISGANVTDGTEEKSSSSNKAPGSSQSAPAAVKLTVTLGGELLSYDSIDALPSDIATTKTFTVTHNRTYYDTDSKTTSSGCGGSSTTYYFYYYNTIASVTEAEGAKQSTKDFKDAAKTLSDNSTFINGSLDYFVSAIYTDAAAVAANQKTVNDAKAAAIKFSQAAWDRYLKSTYENAIATMNSNITLATEIVSVGTVAFGLVELKDAGYAGMNEAQLRALYSSLTTGLSTYNKATQDAKNYILASEVEGKKFVPADIQTFAAEVLVEIQLIELRALKIEIDNTIPGFSNYTEDDVIGNPAAVSGATLSLNKGTVDGYIRILNDDYPANLVDIVMRGYKDILSGLSTDLQELIEISGYNDQFSAKYAEFISDVYGATDITKDSAALVEILKGVDGAEGKDSWYTKLKNLIKSIEKDLEPGTADKIMKTLDNDMKDHMDKVYDTLHSRVEAQIDVATELYSVIKALNGQDINIITVSNYSVYKKAFESIDVDTYNYLKDEAKNFDMPQSTIDKYNALGKDFKAYEAFIATGGFSSFSQILGNYVDREVLPGDIIRDEEYDVDKAKVENVISGLDKLITSDAVGGILGGLLGGAEGEGFDIGTMLEDLVVDMLFTDDFINTVMQMLYPLVLGELIKVWEKEIPNLLAGDLPLDITINKTIRQIVADAALPLYPDQVAGTLADKYTGVKDILNKAGTEYEFEKTSHTEVDDEGNSKTVIDEVTVISTPWDDAALLDETGEKLILDWGIAAAKEKYKKGDITKEAFMETFYQTFDDAMSGLRPLFEALIANTSWKAGPNGEGRVDRVAYASVPILGTQYVALTLDVAACAGYANLLVPIYEVLGADFTAPATVESYAANANSIADLLEAVLSPIFNFLSKIGDAPLSTIISILPNLCYALSMQMVPSLLKVLEVVINYNVAVESSFLQNCVKDYLPTLEPKILNVGEILDLDSLIDLSGGVNSLLSMLGLPIPELAQGELAQMGELTKFTSQRYKTHYDKAAVNSATGLNLGANEAITIKADKGAVGNYLLGYIFNILGDEEAFRGLLGMLITVKDENGEAVKDADGKSIPDEAKIEETIASFNEMDLFAHGTENAIAAVVELFNQEENLNFAEYTWYEDELFVGTVEGLTPAMKAYLSYDNDLTKDKAAYIVEHLDEIIGGIFNMINGEDAEAFSVGAELDKLIGGLFTNETITALAKALSGLDLNALLAGDTEEAPTEGEDEPSTVAEGEEPDAGADAGSTEATPAIDITALIKSLLGIDLSGFAAYKDIADDYDWGVTDADSFAEVLTDILTPFYPLINFILKGDDLTIVYGDKNPSITLKGYNGYDTAIVPLLEALGAEVKDLEETNDVLLVVIDALFGVLDKITGKNAIEEILNILPGILYFLKSNALATVVDNLLHPVYQLLDTLRPIIDINLDELLDTLFAAKEPAEGEEAKPAIDIDLDKLDIDFVLGLVKDLLGLDLSGLGSLIEDVCKIAVTDYKSKSSLIGANGKKGAYVNGKFDATDLVAVVLSFALDWCRVEANVNALADLIGGEDEALKADVKKYIAGIYDLVEKIDITYEEIAWDAIWPDGYDKANVESFTVAPTIESITTYPTDWTEETAAYIDANLETIIASVLKMAGVEGDLSDMLKKEVNFLTGANLNALVTMLVDLLGKLDAEVVDAIGALVGADLDALKAYKADEEKTYTTVEFAQELAKILGTIPEIVNLVFFADDFAIFNKEDGSDALVITGAYGYAKGLAPILEALGCKDLPAADSKDVEGVLVSIAKRFDEILADPIDEILNALPNVLYFLNVNGVGTSLKNMLAAVTNVTDAITENFGVNADLFAIINNAINDLLPEGSQTAIDVRNVDLATIFALVEELLGLELDAAANILVNFCVGKIEAFESVSGTYAFRMVYDTEYARYDMITILVTVALMLVENEQNAAKLDEMIGTDIMSALKNVFGESAIEYTAPNWDYALGANGAVDAMKYTITYPTNWTEETAQYVTEKLPEIGDLIAGMIDGNYTSLAALLQDNVNVFTADNLDKLVALITELLADIDDGLLEAAGLLLNVDIVGLKKYRAPEDVDTTKEFAEELANVLSTYAEGVVEWLLLGRDYTFFVDESTAEDDVIITITGAHGYAEGLALLLEALGCKNLPDAYAGELTTAEIIEGVLVSLADRIDAILEKPVVEVLALLPNLLYFLNTNGVAAVFDNLTAALTALLDKLAVFGLEVDINDLVDLKSLMGIEDTEANIDLDNLTIADLLEAVSLMTGLNLTVINDVLVNFALGKIEAYDSVSKECGQTKKMLYESEFDTYDMVTVIANLLILTIAEEENAEFIKGLVGAEAYSVICALLDMEEVPVQEFSWLFTDKADTGYVFSAISASDFYGGEVYGDIYTEEMAQYIADNFGEFVDNVIYLLGINIDGKSVDDLKELLNGLVNGSLYNSENIVAIRDALAGVLAGVKDLEANGKPVGQYIAEVLKKANIADINAVADVEVPEFTENREMFVASLCDVLEPLYGVLKYVLADEDITFFVNLDKSAAITLKGAEGYAYGIIPLLETLECENILTPDEYYAAVEANGDVLLTSFIDPLLDRVDVILNNPADEILNMLPNLIYFINSNGVDTVVKNTLNAVYGLLNAIEPIAKIDLYELIGLDLSTLTFEQLFNMLLDMIADSTGYEFTTLDASAIVELSVGTLESYTSKNGKTAYKMVYASADEVEGGKTEMVTVVERLLLTFIMHENNQEMLIGLLKDNFGMTEDGEKYMRALLQLIADCTLDNKLGMETALATIYYIYYGVDIGVGESATGMKDLNAEWTKLLADMRNSKDEGEAIAGEIITGILGLDIFEDIIDPEEGVAPNGLIAFFQKIIEFFKGIGEWFRNIFNK